MKKGAMIIVCFLGLGMFSIQLHASSMRVYKGVFKDKHVKLKIKRLKCCLPEPRQ